MENELFNKEIDQYYTAIGFDLAQKGDHLNLLTGSDEQKYFNILIEMLPNISNVDIIQICNLATLMSTFKRLGMYIEKIDENVELYLKLIQKRNDTVAKIDKILSSFGFTAVTRAKMIIPYELEESEN